VARGSGKAGLEFLLRIISLCEDAQRRSFNPFEVEVKESLEAIRRYLPHWHSFEEFCLDGEAVNNLTKVIRLQGDWIKYRASPLYVDSDLIRFKVGTLKVEQLAATFLKAWHPLIFLEQLSAKRLKEAMDYWNKLHTLEERSLNFGGLQTVSAEPLRREDLSRLKLLPDREFNEALRVLWQELRERSEGGGKIPYLDFVGAETYEETVIRAYLLSYLVTYGYANLEVKPLEEEVFIIPHKKQRLPSRERAYFSVSIPIDYQSWKDWQQRRRGSGG